MEQSDIVEKAQDSLKKLASTGIGMSLTAWDEVSNNLLECTTEITRLRAALAEKMAVKVKPLVWEPCEDWKVCSKERAPAFGGEYQMVLLDPKDDPRPSLYFEIGLGAFMFRFEQGEPDHLGPTGPKKFPTFAAAKAAAQADYTARILSAVDPDEITSLRAALADAQAVGFAAGVEAVAKEIERDDDNIGRAMSMAICCSGHECGCMGASVRDYLVYNIRALTPPDATAAAARVLLPGMEQRHIDHMTSLGRDPEKYTSEYRMAADILRAIAGDTP